MSKVFDNHFSCWQNISAFSRAQPGWGWLKPTPLAVEVKKKDKHIKQF